jgi:hypothetical protein
MFDVDELAQQIHLIEGLNHLTFFSERAELSQALAESLIPYLDARVSEVQQNSEFNFKVLEIVFNYLLENDMVEDWDIETQMRGEDAAVTNYSSLEARKSAQTFINVYERLRHK